MRGIIDRLGAVHLPLVAAAVLTLSLASASAQVVEQPQTWDNLNEQWPCNNGLTNRIARVMDADSTSDIGGGGGSTQVWVQCDGVETWSIVNIGGGAGGSGDVVGPASATDAGIAMFDSTTGKLLKATGNPRAVSKILVLGDPTQNFDTRLDASTNNVFKIRTGDDLHYQVTSAGELRSYRYDGGTYIFINGEKQTITPSSGNIEIVGSLDLADPGTRPSCDSTKRGRIFVDEGGAGVADTVEICTKDAADAYAWRSVLP